MILLWTFIPPYSFDYFKKGIATVLFLIGYELDKALTFYIELGYEK